MTSARRPTLPTQPVGRSFRHAVGALAGLALCLVLSGCATFGFGRRNQVPESERPVVQVPAQVVANFFFVECAQSDGHTYRFLVDTGSSVTYVSSALADSLKRKERRKAPPRTVTVRGANGKEVELPSITLKHLRIGGEQFDDVAAVVYDFSELSAHAGMPIDGIVGFPVFRRKLLTLDYPAARLEIAPNPLLATAPTKSPRVSVIPYSREQSTPLVQVQMANESFFVLLDSGSDLGLSLNPSGLHPRFAHGPRVGMMVGSLDGNKRQLVGRLEQNIVLGNQLVERPVVDLTDRLSSLGGELLRYFRLTFDQQRHLVTLVRNSDGPVQMPGRRSTGLSFRRFPNYWRLLAIVPDTPNSALPVEPGDLCVRINGELVENWTLQRYTELIQKAPKITYTFLSGSKELDHPATVFNLVP